MTTIILTLIGILLAAVAALMVIFYGGDAFSSSSTGAHANTLQNAGTNVISAVSLARAELGTEPADLAALQSGGYLTSTPAMGDIATGTQSLAAGLYKVPGVTTEVCNKVNSNLGVAPGAADYSLKMGCTVDGTDNVFYAKA